MAALQRRFVVFKIATSTNPADNYGTYHLEAMRSRQSELFGLDTGTSFATPILTFDTVEEAEAFVEQRQPIEGTATIMEVYV